MPPDWNLTETLQTIRGVLRRLEIRARSTNLERMVYLVDLALCGLNAPAADRTPCKKNDVALALEALRHGAEPAEVETGQLVTAPRRHTVEQSSATRH